MNRRNLLMAATAATIYAAPKPLRGEKMIIVKGSLTAVRVVVRGDEVDISFPFGDGPTVTIKVAP